jgi:hypothetical protein
MWVHFYSGLLFAILLLYLGIKFRDNITQISKNVIICLVSFSVVIITLLPAIVSIFVDRTSIPPWFGYTGMWVVPGIVYEFFGNYSMLVYLLTTMFIIGCISLWFKDRENFIFISIVLSLTFLASIYYSYKMPMVGRYLIIILPIIFMPIAVAFSNFYELLEKIHKHLGIFIFIILIVINVPLLGLYYTTYSKEDLRGLSEYVSKISNEGDYLVLLTDGMVFRYYYSNTTDGTILYPSCVLEDLIRLNQTRDIARMIIMPPYNKTAIKPEMDWILENSDEKLDFGNEVYIYLIK